MALSQGKLLTVSCSLQLAGAPEHSRNVPRKGPSNQAELVICTQEEVLFIIYEGLMPPQGGESQEDTGVCHARCQVPQVSLAPQLLWTEH